MSDNTGWTFSNANDMDWQALGDKIGMKVLAPAGGKMIALFKFEAGYVGGTHHHEEPEFTYVLEGEIVSNGVTMTAGGAYGVEAGTDHTEFRTDTGCTVVSVFKAPG